LRPLALTAPLRHPVVAQLGRYAIAGVVTGVIGTGCVLLLSGPAGVAIQLAILASYPLVLTVHFLFQRYFVFAGRERYALGGATQLRRYLVIVGTQYCCVAAGTALLVHVSPLDDQLAYLAALGTMTTVTFVVMRLRVFH
jgi:putative flippase GtrA